MFTYDEYVKKYFFGVRSPTSKKGYKMHIAGETAIQGFTSTMAIIDFESDFDEPDFPDKSNAFAFGSIGCKPCPAPCSKAGVKQKEETKMAYDTKTEAETLRDYLKSRLNEVFFNVRSDITAMFHLYDYQGPKSYKDLIDWIKNDKFTLDTKVTAKIDAAASDGVSYGNPFVGIKWTDPNQPDRAGFDKAEAELNKAKQKVRDLIATDPNNALKAIYDLESFKPSNAPVVATPAV